MKKSFNKKVILAVLLVALLIAIVGGVTYAFFNYTRTGVANTLQVGRIAFNSTQNNTITLENVFPTSSTNLNSSNSDTVTITITGDTTYSEGIEYKVTLEDVNNTINGKEVPISIRAVANNLGTASSDYYTERTNKTKIYKLNSEGEAYDGKYVLVGYIPSGEEGVNGSIDITAFIDTNKVAITDTLENGAIVETGYVNGTTDDWVAGREVFTTTEWNSFNSGNPLSFKVKVEVNEGIWVEPEKFLTMKNLYSITEWTNIRENITSIEFHKDGIAPLSYETIFDVTDTTSDQAKGPITLYTVDDGLGNNTYKAIIVANDTIYAPANSMGMFGLMTNLITFYSKNFVVDNVNDVSWMFQNCSNLVNINSLFAWNTYNISNFYQIFTACSKLENIKALSYWNFKNAEIIGMFNGCTNLKDITPLSNWNVSNVKDISTIFGGCSNLTDISPLSNWNTSNVENMNMSFLGTKISNLDSLSNWNVQNVTLFGQTFASCTSLEDASGINNWDLNSNAKFTAMFKNTPVHPEFTKVSGTWNAKGTFTPNA